MTLDYKTGLDILFCAEKQVEEEKLYMRWIAGPQFEMSLSDFRKNLGIRTTEQNVIESAKEETEEEILAKVKRIIG